MPVNQAFGWIRRKSLPPNAPPSEVRPRFVKRVFSLIDFMALGFVPQDAFGFTPEKTWLPGLWPVGYQSNPASAKRYRLLPSNLPPFHGIGRDEHRHVGLPGKHLGKPSRHKSCLLPGFPLRESTYVRTSTRCLSPCRMQFAKPNTFFPTKHFHHIHCRRKRSCHFLVRGNARYRYYPPQGQGTPSTPCLSGNPTE